MSGLKYAKMPWRCSAIARYRDLDVLCIGKPGHTGPHHGEKLDWVTVAWDDGEKTATRDDTWTISEYRK